MYGKGQDEPGPKLGKGQIDATKNCGLHKKSLYKLKLAFGFY